MAPGQDQARDPLLTLAAADAASRRERIREWTTGAFMAGAIVAGAGLRAQAGNLSKPSISFSIYVLVLLLASVGSSLLARWRFWQHRRIVAGVNFDDPFTESIPTGETLGPYAVVQSDAEAFHATLVNDMLFLRARALVFLVIGLLALGFFVIGLVLWGPGLSGLKSASGAVSGKAFVLFYSAPIIGLSLMVSALRPLTVQVYVDAEDRVLRIARLVALFHHELVEIPADAIRSFVVADRVLRVKLLGGAADGERSVAVARFSGGPDRSVFTLEDARKTRVANYRGARASAAIQLVIGSPAGEDPPQA